ncbi:MAG: AAA family ATPase, partial [Nanoarchaeota archaeon]
MLLKEIFGDNRICALAGDKSTGKTNNLMALLKNFRNHNKQTKIYVFGIDEVTLKWLRRFNDVYEISTLEQLSDKKDSLIIIDEFQKLQLNDRRYKELLNKFVDFIYHNNNWAILSCPNLREYNSIIG